FLRYVTALPIDDVPEIDERDPDEELDQRRQAFFASPDEDPITLHVTPTYLGRFGAKAMINFSTKQITAIVNKGPDAWWRAFAEAYGKDPKTWGDPQKRETLGFQSQWWPAFFALPLRLFNVRMP